MDYSWLHYWKIKLTRLKFAKLCFFFTIFLLVFLNTPPHLITPRVSSSTHGDISKSMQILLHYDNIGAQCYLKTRECEKLGDRGERILVSAQQLGSWIKRGKKKKGETDSAREAEEFEKSGEKNWKKESQPDLSWGTQLALLIKWTHDH